MFWTPILQNKDHAALDDTDIIVQLMSLKISLAGFIAMARILL
jgi:hypothetical protein